MVMAASTHPPLHCNLTEGHRQAILAGCIGLAFWHARRHFESFGGELADLQQEACLALTAASYGFDPDRGQDFAPLASFAITRRLHALSRRQSARRLPQVSIHAGDDGELPIAMAEHERVEPDTRAALQRGLASLRPMERLAVERCVGRGETLRAVASVAGVSHQRIGQLRARGLERLRAVMGDE
jgi:RNA polymerase sigma factor (sigma-70 family)